MRVGLDTEHFDVHGQDIAVSTHVPGRSCRDVEILPAQPDAGGYPRGYGVGEIQPDPTLHPFRLLAWHQMELEQHVSPRVQAPRHAGWSQWPQLTRCPPEEVAGRKPGGERRHALVA